MNRNSAALVLIAALCSGLGCAQTGGRSFEQAPRGGFTPEIDEPATRGTLTRVTPPDLFVVGSYAVSEGDGEIVFSTSSVNTRALLSSLS